MPIVSPLEVLAPLGLDVDDERQVLSENILKRLVQIVLSHPEIIAFREVLEWPPLVSMEATKEFQTLKLFAYGTCSEYEGIF